MTMYHIAVEAAWSVRSAAATIAAKPEANFTNSTKNGSMRLSASRLFLFFGLFISFYFFKITLRSRIARVELYDLCQKVCGIWEVKHVLIIH